MITIGLIDFCKVTFDRIRSFVAGVETLLRTSSPKVCLAWPHADQSQCLFAKVVLGTLSSLCSLSRGLLWIQLAWLWKHAITEQDFEALEDSVLVESSWGWNLRFGLSRSEIYYKPFKIKFPNWKISLLNLKEGYLKQERCHLHSKNLEWYLRSYSYFLWL